MIDSFTGEYAFLSNFHPSPLRIATMEYPTAEHAFQAAKTYEVEWRRNIAAAETPREAKQLGRRAPIFSNWNRIRFDNMTQVITEKFRWNDELAAKLIALPNGPIIEGNTWHDQTWGDCRCSAHASIPGLNALGIILSRHRLELIAAHDN